MCISDEIFTVYSCDKTTKAVYFGCCKFLGPLYCKNGTDVKSCVRVGLVDLRSWLADKSEVSPVRLIPLFAVHPDKQKCDQLSLVNNAASG